MMEHQLSSDERERKNRFAYTGADTPRSASQPPTTNGDGFYSMPAMQIYGSPGGRIGNGNSGGSGAYGTGGHSSSPWAMPVSGQGGGRGGPSLARSASSSIGIPSSLPRSSSFSERLGYGAGGAGGGGGSFANAIRESHSFPSTFEDDESEVMSDATGEYTYPSESAGQFRGRHFLAGDTRSRSQSLAAATTTSRPLPIGSPPASAGWAAGSGPLSIPGRFGDFKIPGTGSGGTGLGSRYGSLGALARSPVGVGVGATSSPSPTGGLRVSNNNPGGAAHAELTNISPLARDVGQIMLDEENFNNSNNNNSSVWVGNGNGGESGTTSRRHSVSVVQPRRGIVGFNAPDRDASGHGQDDGNGNGQPFYLQSNGHGSGNGGAGLGGGGGGGGGGGLTISDDELAVGLNMLQLNASQQQQQQQQQQRPSRHSLPPSQPSSLPIYAPLSRTSQDAHAHGPGSLAESLSIPTGEHFPGRGPGRMLRSPSESGYSVSSGGGSPPASHSPALESSASASPYISRQHLGGGQQHQHQHQHQHQQQRYVPGHGIQYIPEDAPAPSPAPGPVPTSPTFMRSAAGPNQSFMLGLQGQVQGQGQTGPLSPTRGQQIQQMQMQQLLQQHQHQQQQQQQQYGGAQILQRRTSQSEGPFGHPHQPLHIQTQTQQHPQQQQHQQNTFADVGRGVPLSAVPPTWSLYIVEFKAGRTDLFYVPDTDLAGPLQVGDLVIVEADRGKDLGKVVNDTITAAEVEAFQRQQQQQQQQQSLYSEHGAGYGPTSPDGLGHSTSTGTGVMGVGGGKKEIMPKKIYGKATAQDAQLLVAKHADEAKALALCQTKVKQRKLPMEVIDAEYQWDRRKLTFYFVAEKRIDFRELVRELFRLYKTRIWMASLQGPTSPE